MATLFGETPAAVRQALANERLTEASIIGNLGPGGHGALAGGILGRGILSAFGVEDPRLRQAQELQAIEQEISQMGLEPGTPEFTRQTVGMIRSRLGLGPAAQAFEMATQLERQRAEVEALRNGPAAQQFQTEQRTRALLAAGGDPNLAPIIASDPKLWRERMKELTQRTQGTTDFQNFQLAQQVPGFAEYLAAKQNRGATRVNVENYLTERLGKDAPIYRNAEGKPPPSSMTPSEASAAGFEPITKEQQAAATAEATIETKRGDMRAQAENAVAGLRSVTSGLSVGSFASPTDRQRYDNQRRRLSKAMAQLRSPPGVEASQAAEQAMFESLPSLAQAIAAPSSVDALLQDIEAELGQGPPGGRRVEDMTDEELERLAR